jgi:hypothetical protein
MHKRTILTGLGIAAALVVAGTSGAVAGNLVTSRSIQDNTIRSIDLRDGGVHKVDLGKGVNRKLAKSPFKGAYYSVANYNAGDTNAGAIATVACSAETDVAVSGGVQVLGLDAGANSRNTPVSSSFPGRMDWTTNTPRDNRLDGWIVQFGGNAGTTSDKAPEKVQVWALCVPHADIPVVETWRQN